LTILNYKNVKFADKQIITFYTLKKTNQQTKDILQKLGTKHNILIKTTTNLVSKNYF